MRPYHVRTQESLMWAQARVVGRIRVLKAMNYPTELDQDELSKLLQIAWDIDQVINKFHYWFIASDEEPRLPF